MKGNTNTRAALKAESEEVDKHFDKKENDSIDFQVAFQTEVQDESQLWHFIFGHLNFGGMNLLHRRNMVKGLPLIDRPERVCEGCIFGKQHRKTFLVGKSYRAHTRLEIVHSDICGPMQTSSIGGCNYFLTFIDDYSKKTFSYFQQFKALVEN